MILALAALISRLRSSLSIDSLDTGTEFFFCLLGGGWAAGSIMADVLGRWREDTNDGGEPAGNVRDAVELGRRLGWSEKVGCLSTEAAEGSSSSSLSISKCVMLAAALFFGRDLWVRGGSEEKDSGADCGRDVRRD